MIGVGVPIAKFPMDVLEFSSSDFGRAVPFDVPRLVVSCGLAEFETDVAEIAKGALGCDFVTGFAFSNDAPPDVVCTSSIHQDNRAKSVSKPYASTYWRTDPTNLFRYPEFRTDKTYIVLMSEDQVPDESYRNDCYTYTGVKNRLSMLKQHGESILKVSFHWRQKPSDFDNAYLDGFLPQANILFALIAKHKALVPSSRHDSNAAQKFRGDVGRYCPSLTAREREVCSLIAIGMSSVAIGLTLDVSVNTVLTFRRRAYAKLQISSQNELLRLLF